MIAKELLPIYGAIAGDLVGSPYELSGTRIKTIKFPLVCPLSHFTDDTYLTIALMDWIVSSLHLEINDLVYSILRIAKSHPDVGYGHSFKVWMRSDEHLPYNSWGNGSAMRVSPIAVYASSINDVLNLAAKSAIVTHNHPEGIKGAQAVAAAIYLAYHGFSKDNIREFVTNQFGYNLTKSISEIRETYEFDSSCQGSVPEAITAFLESVDFEDALRLSVSLGGDADTQACIAGSIAAAFYKSIPISLENAIVSMIPEEFKLIETTFCEKVEESNQRGHEVVLKLKKDLYLRGVQTYTFACTDFESTFVPKGTRFLINIDDDSSSIIKKCAVLNNKDVISTQFARDSEARRPGEIDSLWNAGVFIDRTQFDCFVVDLIDEDIDFYDVLW